tara:strand:- start:236 stop:430 length:195 start_codon:yes stop_codon:yes gene_type:complete
MRITYNNGSLISLFNGFIYTGLQRDNQETGTVKTLTIGIWKIEISFAFAWRDKIANTREIIGQG